MAFAYRDLDEKTRNLMLQELEFDLQNDKVYISGRLNDHGESNYLSALRTAISSGNDQTLAVQIRTGYLKANETYTRNGKVHTRRLDPNAANMLAEGEFNRYYMRALCRRVMEFKNGSLIVYRAKEVSNPRSGSQTKIGEEVNPQSLLLDLRENIGIDTFLGLPAGPNSGLSVYLNKDQASTIA